MGIGNSRHQALEDLAAAANVDINEIEIKRDSQGTVIELTVKDCESMQELPPSIGDLENLERLELCFCHDLTSLPKEIGNLKKLKHLTLTYADSMESLPPEIGDLENLERLELIFCNDLTSLPKEIGNLKKLKWLKLSSYYSLKHWPSELFTLEHLERLELCTAFKDETSLPTEIFYFTKLKWLNLTNANRPSRMTHLPSDIGKLDDLEHLNLSFWTELKSLPSTMENLKKLQSLNLSGCRSFQRLPAPRSFRDLTSLILRDCESLQSLPSSLCELPRFENLDLYGCKNLPRPLVEAKDPILFFRKAGLFLVDNPSEIMTRIRGNKDLLFAAVQYPECASGFARAWKNNPELANLRDDLGRNALDLACIECKQSLLFYGRYELEPRCKYKSKTCIVFFAKYLAVSDGSNASVALKFMYKKAHFDKERYVRCLDEENKRFISEYVIDDLAYHDGDTDSAFAKAAQEHDLPKYCMVLERGGRNLHEAIGAEDLICDIDQVRPILRQLAHCLKHLHDKGFVHGDFKPRNAIRDANDRRWQLLDFDAATRVAAPMGLKVSTAYIPPEMVAMDEGKPHLLGWGNVDIGADKVLKADPSFDVWSFGILMYRLLTGINFLEGVNDYDSVNELNLRKLALWNDDKTEKTLGNVNKSSLARNLLRKIMRTNPTERPALSDILEDPFFCPDSVLNDKFDRLVVFQSGPLAIKVLDGSLRRIPLLDFKGEKHLLQEALADAKQVNFEIETVYETATKGGLDAFFETRMGRVMHLSGHSNDTYFLLEQESALGSFLTIEDVGRWKGKLGHLKFVFISGCHSENIGRAFANLAEAPHVIHVICIRGQVDAKAVEVFTFYVYRALACGRSLKGAFGIARKAVAHSQLVVDPSMRGTNDYRRQQAEGFILLPERKHDPTCHDVRIFFDDDYPLPPLPRNKVPTSIVPSLLPSLPAYYVYRELLMYEIIEALSTADVVRVNGIFGIGKTCTVSMICDYMLKRPRSYKIDSLLWLSKRDDPGSVDSNQVELLRKTADLLRSPSDKLYQEVIKSLAGMKSVYMVFDSRGTSQEEKITFNDYFIVKLLQKNKALDKIIIISDEDSDNLNNGVILEEAVQVKVGRLDFEQAMMLFAFHIPDDLKSRPPLRTPTEFEEYLDKFNGEQLEIFWNSFWENEEFWEKERHEGIPQDIIELARNKAKRFLTGASRGSQ